MSRKLIIVLLVGGILYYWQQRSNFAIDQSKIPDLGLVYQEDLSIGNPPIQGALGESLPSNEHCHTIRGRLPRVPPVRNTPAPACVEAPFSQSLLPP
ncbi:MAG: hypothetical protein L0Y38_07810 [Methylococcaceae bacterium]|nr:hypothetical protein [Methylococcaceae bacterium]